MKKIMLALLVAIMMVNFIGCAGSVCEREGHTIEKYDIIKEATCSQEGIKKGICKACQEECEIGIPTIAHTEGDWQVISEPTLDASGVKVKKCIKCGEETNQENFYLDPDEKEKLYKEACERVFYDDLLRTPDKYKGKKVVYSGYVVQICSEATSFGYYSTYRVATSGKYDNIIYIKIDNYGDESRILEDDYISFYGEYDGLFTYETVMGAEITIPSVTVEYVG